MDEATGMYPNLSDLTHSRLTKINEIKDYFIAEIRERETMSKRLSKYTAVIDCFDKDLIVTSATSGGVSIASFVSGIGTPVGTASARFSFEFSIAIGVVKKLLKTTLNNKRSIIRLLCLPESNYQH